MKIGKGGGDTVKMNHLAVMILIPAAKLALSLLPPPTAAPSSSTHQPLSPLPEPETLSAGETGMSMKHHGFINFLEEEGKQL